MRWLSAPAAARALAAAAVLAAAAGSGVLAHEGRSSTGYSVVVGFLHEPAYEGYLNAVFLEVNRTGSQEQDADEPKLGASGAHSGDGKEREGDSEHHAQAMDEEPEDHAAAPAPVTGLEDTLEVEVTHVASAQSTVMALSPLFEHPGAYTADFIPTQPGAYRFRFFGSIEGQPFDEVFESGANTFDAIRARAGAQFPIMLPSVRELEGVVRTSQASADEALEAVAGVRAIGIVGMVIGTVGLVTAAGAIALSIRSRRRA